MWGIRVIIPSKHRAHILQELHRDHPGCSRMKSVARSYLWSGLDADIEHLATACAPCQQNRNAPSPVPLHTHGHGRLSHGSVSTWISLDHS